MAALETAMAKGASGGAPEQRLLLRLEIDEFNARYAAVLDRGNLRAWPSFFADDPLYRVISRENYDGDLPIGLMSCDSRGMLEDRVEAVLNTTMFGPRTIVHYITNIELGAVDAAGMIAAQENFLLVESPVDRNLRLLMAGRYVDRFVRQGGSLLLKERHCVYDSLTVQTSLVYPV
jgi:anthranilate 1,2-dioxygenase small subunit